MKHKLLWTLVFAMLLSVLSGCWDRKDIETRAYVLGIAIDKYPPNPHAGEEGTQGETPPEEEEKLEYMGLHTGRPKYAMTVQVPILKKADGDSGTSSGPSKSGEGANTWEITQIGNSFMSMNREMQSRTDTSLYYEHLQVIILSEEVAREGIEDAIDFFVRDPEMRRRVRVFVSEGQAKAILNVTPKIEDYASIYLSKIPMNATKTSRVVHKTDLGEIVKFIHAGLDFVLPKVIATKDEIKASGGAVFRSGRMVGWVSDLELEGIKFMRNIYMGGIISAPSPGNEEDAIAAMEVTSAKTDIKPIIKDDELSFDVYIKVKGNYAESINMHTHAKLTKEHFDKLEVRLAKEIEQVCLDVTNKMQKEYGADVFHLKQILAADEPAYWKKIADKWDKIYPTVQINIHADVTLVLLGIVQ